MSGEIREHFKPVTVIMIPNRLVQLRMVEGLVKVPVSSFLLV